MLASLSLGGWSLIVAAVGTVIALAGYVKNARAIDDEKRDRRDAIDAGWAREWAAQRPVLYPQRPTLGATGPGGLTTLAVKNGGRGPALNVEGELTLRGERWGGILVTPIAAGDVETALIAGPRVAPPWPRMSGELRYKDLVGGDYVTRFDFRPNADGELELFVHPQEHSPPAAPE